MTLDEMTDFIANECENFNACTTPYKPGKIFLTDDEGNAFTITVKKED